MCTAMYTCWLPHMFSFLWNKRSVKISLMLPGAQLHSFYVKHITRLIFVVSRAQVMQNKVFWNGKVCVMQSLVSLLRYTQSQLMQWYLVGWIFEMTLNTTYPSSTAPESTTCKLTSAPVGLNKIRRIDLPCPQYVCKSVWRVMNPVLYIPMF